MNAQSVNTGKFRFYLGGIMVAGFLLRLNHIGTESITADEVSALLRLRFASFGEMLENGVKPDGHPAFTQVLLWFWIKLFGDSELAVRIPFAIMGTAAIWFAGAGTRRMFGTGAGLAVATSLAFLQFPLMYSQLARPYAPGLFFTMLAFYFLSRFTDRKKVRLKIVAGFALASAGAAYSHYFSLLTALLLGISGLFLVSSQNRKVYFIACAGAILVFLPHLSFTLSQLGIGGVGGPGGWLSAPTHDFFGEHLFHIFYSSRGLSIVVIATAVICLFFNRKRISRQQIAVLLLFLIPLHIGYLYSVYVNPVLQHSVLLFSFPFLLMFLFSWFPEDETSPWPYRFAFVLIIPMVWYITLHKPFRLTDHFGRLKEIVETYVNAEQKYGRSNVDVMFNVDAEYFVDYYLNRSMHTPDTYWYCMFHTDKHDELNQLRSAVENSKAGYFVYGWSTRESFPAAQDIILEKFPCVIEKHEWFNSAVYVFGRYNKCEPTLPEWKFLAGFGEPDGAGERLDSAHQFGPVVAVRVGDVISNPDNILGCHGKIKLYKPDAEVVWVMEFIRDGKQLLWTGHSSKNQLDSATQEWQRFLFVQRPPVELLTSDSIKAYIFSPNFATVEFNHLIFATREGHRGIYGNRPDYK